MADRASTLVWATNTGLQQRRGTVLLNESTVLEADNLSWLTESAVQMRQGSAPEDLTGSGLTGEIVWLQSFLPADDGPEERWYGANNSGTIAVRRLVSGVYNTVTFADTPVAASFLYTHAAALNGKLFIAYNSDVNRLHVWDGSSLRRVGQSTPSAPSVANTGAGAYAATARYYRVNTRIKSGDDIQAESELSTATSFTPSGGGTAARVSRPSSYDSAATHWVVWGLIGSSGDTYDLYEELSEIAIGTTTYDDSTAPASYDGDFPPELGINVPPPSAKSIISDGSRLLMAGAWETSADADQTEPKVARVWYSRVLGETDRGDDEAIPHSVTQVNYIDVGDAAEITGLAGPLFGEVYVFKQRSIYKLVPTGDAISPYAVVIVSETCGAVGQRVICAATNDTGAQTAIYFADEHALYMISDGGLVNIGAPIARDLRAQPITADAALLAYDPYQQHVLFVVVNTPSTRNGSYNAFFGDVLKQRWSGFSLSGASGGWTLGVGALGTSTTLAGSGATIMSATIGTVSTTATRRLVLGGQDANGAGAVTVLGNQCVLDGSTAFTSTARFRAMPAPGQEFTAYHPTIYYRNPQGSTSGTLTCTLQYLRPTGPDGESVTVSQSVTLEAMTDDTGIELKQHTFEGIRWADMSVLDVRVSLTYSGTAFVSAVPPSVEMIFVPVIVQERLAR